MIFPQAYRDELLKAIASIDLEKVNRAIEILAQARHYRAEGANVIDLGCDPGTTWAETADTVRALRDEGFRVSTRRHPLGLNDRNGFWCLEITDQRRRYCRLFRIRRECRRIGSWLLHK